VRQRRRARKAAQGSAAAAQQSIEQADKHFIVSNRPWVTVAQLEILQRAPNTLPFNIVMNMENGGITPAIRVASAQWVDILAQLPDPPNYQDYVPVTRAAIGPHLGGQIPASVMPTNPELQGIVAGHLNIFVYGFVRYDDIFGGHHETKWAFEYNRATRQFAVLPFHNQVI